MKKIFLSLALILLINFASAYNGLDRALDSIDPQTVFLFAVFIISFALLNFALTRVFKKQRQIGILIALVLSFLITYGLRNSSLSYSMPSVHNWVGNLTWVTLLWVLAGAAIVYWIIREERKR